MGEPRISLFKGRDPEDVMSLARCLRRCRSTPDLSYTAASLLSKTLTARATRLESTASKVRLAAEKEAYRRATVEKRRRALGPKNSSDFMSQTLRDRKKEQTSTPHPRSTPMSDCVGLEDDDDIRVLLQRAYSSSSSIRSESSRLSGKPKPASGQSYGRSRCTAESPLLHGRPSAAACKGYVRRPHTAGAAATARSFDGRKFSPADVTPLRREILIRSHGETRHLQYPTEPFETTAMGRKARCRTPGRKAEKNTQLIPWIPAKTTDSLDRLQQDADEPAASSLKVACMDVIWADRVNRDERKHHGPQRALCP